jgi:hypothetical protein
MATLEEDSAARTMGTLTLDWFALAGRTLQPRGSSGSVRKDWERLADRIRTARDEIPPTSPWASQARDYLSLMLTLAEERVEIERRIPRIVVPGLVDRAAIRSSRRAFDERASSLMATVSARTAIRAGVDPAAVGAPPEEPDRAPTRSGVLS